MRIAEGEKRYILVSTTWGKKGRKKSTARECTAEEREEIERGETFSACVHCVTSATCQPTSAATLVDICRHHERLLRAPERDCRHGLRLREELEEAARARPLPVTLVSTVPLPSVPPRTTTELTTKALCAELQAARPGTAWRFFHEPVRGGRRSEISCSGRLLRDVLPPPLRSATGVTLYAELEPEEGKAAAAEGQRRVGASIQDEDLVGKLIRRTEAADDPSRQGEKENAKRKLDQYLARHPEVAELVPRYRAKLRRV